ncbi:MAG: Holliday junction resolvase RuvX [Flavobacteriales bacterium]
MALTKIVGIDYGTVRTGIAMTDSARIIAWPVQTVATKEVFGFLEKLFEKEKTEIVVVGEARYRDGSASEITGLQQKFVEQLQKKFPAIVIERVNEARTSIMAAELQLMLGMKKRDRAKKGNLDMMSAAFILQSYLDKLKS